MTTGQKGFTTKKQLDCFFTPTGWLVCVGVALALSGCAGLPWQAATDLPQFEHAEAAKMPVDKIAGKMVDELAQTYPPAKTKLTVGGTGGQYRAALESAMRQAGFGVGEHGVAVGYVLDRFDETGRWRASLQTPEWRLDRVFEVNGAVVRSTGGSVLRESNGSQDKITSTSRYGGTNE
jgi:Conjugal transfer protein TrbH.